MNDLQFQRYMLANIRKLVLGVKRKHAGIDKPSPEFEPPSLLILNNKK